MDRAPRQLLILIGASVRSAAQSALRAGYEPWCADLFGDRDLVQIAPVVRCPVDRYPRAFLEYIEQAPLAPVLLTGAMENYPDILEPLSLRRPLFGSPVASIRSVRDPLWAQRLPRIPGIDHPRVLIGSTQGVTGEWLLKPRRGAGGRGIRHWHDQSLDGDHFLQTFVTGDPLAAAFHSDDHGNAHLLGVTRQIVGDPFFGAHDFQYCGSIGPINLPADASHALKTLGHALSQIHGLRGVWGIDMIRDADGVLHPVEVNPRYTASMEIVETATGNPVLRPSTAADARPTTMMHAKAVLFASRDCTAPDLFMPEDRAGLADIPNVGEEILIGRPICTIKTDGRDEGECLDRLHAMAARLYTRL